MIKIQNNQADEILRQKIPGYKKFSLIINYPNAKLDIDIASGKGLGKGGAKIRKHTYYFSADDGDNCFYGKSPQLEGFQIFHLFDDHIEVTAAMESEPYVTFKHKKSLKNVANKNSGKTFKYKGKDYDLKIGKCGGKYIMVNFKKIYVNKEIS